MQRGPTTYVNEDHEAREYDHSLVLVRLAGDAKIRPEQNITVVEGLAGEGVHDQGRCPRQDAECDKKDRRRALLGCMLRAFIISSHAHARAANASILQMADGANRFCSFSSNRPFFAIFGMHPPSF